VKMNGKMKITKRQLKRIIREQLLLEAWVHIYGDNVEEDPYFEEIDRAWNANMNDMVKVDGEWVSREDGVSGKGAVKEWDKGYMDGATTARPYLADDPPVLPPKDASEIYLASYMKAVFEVMVDRKQSSDPADPIRIGGRGWLPGGVLDDPRLAKLHRELEKRGLTKDHLRKRG